MTPGLASALMPLIRGMDPETAHGWGLRALRAGLVGRDRTPDDPLLASTALGLRFRNPIGLAAGFDKDAVAVLPLMRLGFGLVEAGTVTPRPQRGNPRPRIFRLPEERAVINRLGFNNGGLDAYVARLAALRQPGARPLPAVLGANIGINKEGADPARDYPDLYAAVAPHADYVVVNVSSPNTPGLRDLQGEAQLAAILGAVSARRATLPRRPPLLVKLAPDLAPGALPPIVEACVAHGVEGLIISNTTIARPPDLRGAHRGESGGLSGPPLLAASTDMLRAAFRLSRNRLVLIGAGGVDSGATAYAKIRAGASLVQLYAAFAYDGPALVGRIRRELAALLRRDGFTSLAQAVGVDAFARHTGADAVARPAGAAGRDREGRGGEQATEADAAAPAGGTDRGVA
ncbi:quinone-dependent dihydroorotate dehydrogenase [Roseomonas sp. NAR14]|uniref:Dihydroorotate dehydrogenase (quinone) n=1 Tax=Roseomonas acroporae TaxID=2937791 RepID=A0A9X1YEQ1_9PROT|nr:quinone-dependent dihydroorotate dehydrogenase [Roseomonas acroporae]MCK8784951.1 quinone-dependent dihydroorotate dehydrogenase [Roseomonas acroporae]